MPGFGYGFRHYNNLRRTLPRMQQLIAMLDTLGAVFVTAGEFLDGLRGTSPIDPGAHGGETAAASGANARPARHHQELTGDGERSHT